MAAPPVPKAVRLLSEKWQVHVKKELKDDEKRGVDGLCVYDRYLIQLSRGARQRMRKTLLHEVIHALDHLGQIGLTEKQVVALENMLFTTFCENIELRDYVFKIQSDGPFLPRMQKGVRSLLS